MPRYLKRTVVRYGRLLLDGYVNPHFGIKYLECTGETGLVAQWARKHFERNRFPDSADVIAAGAKYFDETELPMVFDAYLHRNFEAIYMARQDLGDGALKKRVARTARNIIAHAGGVNNST